MTALTAEQIFAVWAPDRSPWSLWVKPVLFAQMTPELLASHIAAGLTPVLEAVPPWLPPAAEKVALIINLPGPRSVSFAMGAASAGYCPIPLYNALPGPAGNMTIVDDDYIGPLLVKPSIEIGKSVVDVYPIIAALIAATPQLAQFKLDDQAPPAFMLDSNRRTGAGPLVPNRFDNRSVSFPTDFPSANFLLSRGIRKVLLIQDQLLAPDTDLAHTLLRWQQAGIKVESVALAGGEPREQVIAPPSLFRVLWYRLRLLAGLRPQLGGFGGLIPEPSSGHGG